MALEPLPFRGLSPPPGFAMFFYADYAKRWSATALVMPLIRTCQPSKSVYMENSVLCLNIPFTDQRLA